MSPWVYALAALAFALSVLSLLVLIAEVRRNRPARRETYRRR